MGTSIAKRITARPESQRPAPREYRGREEDGIIGRKSSCEKGSVSVVTGRSSTLTPVLPHTLRIWCNVTTVHVRCQPGESALGVRHQ